MKSTIKTPRGAIITAANEPQCRAGFVTLSLVHGQQMAGVEIPPHEAYLLAAELLRAAEQAERQEIRDMQSALAGEVAARYAATSAGRAYADKYAAKVAP